MANSRGKDLEQEIRKSLTLPSATIDRFADPMAGYAGIRNFCDFGVFCYPFKYYLECKERKGNTLNFKGDITQNQWDGLLERAPVPGVLAGLVIWYIDHDRTFFVDIAELKQWRDTGAKSIHIDTLLSGEVPSIQLPATKKRVLFTYHGEEILRVFSDYTRMKWGDELNGYKTE